MAVNPARLSISMVDSFGRRASVPFRLTVDDAVTAAQQVSEAVTLGALVDALSGASIVQVDFGVFKNADGSWKSAPDDGSNNGLSALISFSLGAAYPHCPVVIPAILASKLSGGTLNTADADVAAFISHLISPPSGFTFVAENGSALSAAAWSRLVVRKWGRVSRK